MKRPNLSRGWSRKNGASIITPTTNPNRDSLIPKVTFFVKIFNNMFKSEIVMVTLLISDAFLGSSFGKSTCFVSAFKSINLGVSLVMNMGFWSRTKIGRKKTPKIPNKSVHRKIMRKMKISSLIEGPRPMFFP